METNKIAITSIDLSKYDGFLFVGYKHNKEESKDDSSVMIKGNRLLLTNVLIHSSFIEVGLKDIICTASENIEAMADDNVDDDDFDDFEYSPPTNCTPCTNDDGSGPRV